MEDILNKLQNEPIALVFIAIVAVVIAFLFMIPVFLNYIKSFNLPVIKSEDEETESSTEVVEEETEEAKETEEETEEIKAPEVEEAPKETKTVSSVASKIITPAPGFQKLNLKFGFKFAPLKYIFLVVIGLILVGTAIFAFDFLLRPVRMMDSWQLKLEKGGQLSKLQAGGLSSWPEAKIYLLDVRSRDSYKKGHLRGAENLPSYKAAEFYPIENIPVVVYSSEFSLGDARAVADAIDENGKSGRITYENPGKIFIVKDGFEGLKKAGFKIEY